jgi:replicative DNA helicase
MREGLSGLSTGFRGLDQATDGFRGGQLIIWAGRPAMGKSTSSLQMAVNMALTGKRVLFFSMEMKDVDISKKVLASVSNVDYQVIKSANTTPQEFDAISRGKMIMHNDLQGLMINKDTELSASTIRSTIRNAKKGKGLDCVIIDHISLIKGSNRYKGNRVLEIGEISRTLKKTALDLNIPIVCLSQLNRGVEHRSVPTPQLSDLRESGDIEQDADIVVFNYRPEYYDIETTEEGNSTDGLFQLIIAKNREGQCGTVELRCDLAKSQVMDAPTAADEYF